MVPESRSVGDRQRGSVLMLMPAAVLVVVILGAIAVDLSAVFVQQRELVAAAQAAANDAAAEALDRPAFYASGALGHDARRLDAVVERSLAARGIRARAETSVVDQEVVVELTGEATLVFTDAVPGADGAPTIRGRATAELILR